MNPHVASSLSGSLDDDLATWLRRVNRPDLIPEKERHENPSNQTVVDNLIASLTLDDRRKIWEIYAEDYYRFGYDPSVLGAGVDF